MRLDPLKGIFVAPSKKMDVFVNTNLYAKVREICSFKAIYQGGPNLNRGLWGEKQKAFDR